MKSQDRHVIAVFHSTERANFAIDQLVQAGISPAKFSLLVSDSGRQHHFNISDEKTKTAEGAGYGAVLGGLIGGLSAVAAGIASVTIPGVLLIAGPLGAALTAGAAGAAVGGLAGGLAGMGMAKDEVELVERELAEGSILVAVHDLNSEDEGRVEKVFKDVGAARVH